MQFEGFAIATGGHRNQDGSLSGTDLLSGLHSGEIVFEIPNPQTEIKVEFGGMAGRQFFRRSTIVIGRTQGGGVGESGEAIFRYLDRDDGIESQ